MSTTLVIYGQTMAYLNETGSDISVNTPVIQGNKLGIAAVDIPDGEVGTLEMEGVHRLPKKTGSGEAIAPGTSPVFDKSTGKVMKEGSTTAAGDLSGALTAWSELDGSGAGDNDDTVLVKLNEGGGTVAA